MSCSPPRLRLMKGEREECLEEECLPRESANLKTQLLLLSVIESVAENIDWVLPPPRTVEHWLPPLPTTMIS
jgi:hypothetical protein